VNLESYLQHPPTGSSDPYRVRRLATELLKIRRTSTELVDAIGELTDDLSAAVDCARLARARDLAVSVAAFFPPEFHLHRSARALVNDQDLAAIQARSYTAGLDFNLTVPMAAVRARRLDRYLHSHGPSEVACALGRARTLNDNGPFIVLFVGAVTGVVTFVLLNAVAGPWWLNLVVAAMCCAGAATQAIVTIRQVLDGERVVLTWPLIALTLQAMPPGHRERYAEEFRAELYELTPWGQVRYSVNQVVRAPALRASLVEQTQESDRTSDSL
jgi:hypothetical protein